MTNPDAEREAAWQAHKAAHAMYYSPTHEEFNKHAFDAGYAAARASAPAPDAGEREAIRHDVTEFIANRMPLNAATLAEYVLTLLDADSARDQALILQGVKAGLEEAAKSSCPRCSRGEELLGAKPFGVYHLSERGNMVKCHAMFVWACDVAAIAAQAVEGESKERI